jgi:hypothetical protein
MPVLSCVLQPLAMLPSCEIVGSIADQFRNPSAIARKIKGEPIIDEGATSDAAKSK